MAAPGRRLAPVPERAPRVLGLIRVSKERDGMVSPEVQRVSIESYAAGRGYTVADWMEGIDQSGSRARSAWWPTLERAVSAVEEGVFDGIVVWKFDRTSRNRLKWAVAIDRVDTAGALLESATEQVDASTAAGRFTRGMFGEMAAFRAETIGEGWREAHANRVRSGRPATGKPRYGYTYDAEAKLHVPDPETGPVLAELYRRYVAGESTYALVRWLNAHGWRTTAGGLWSDQALRRVMDSGFASGRFRAGGDPRRGVAPSLHPGVHEPLIEEKLWQAYLDSRERRRERGPRRERSQYLLSGLVRCARCERPMAAGQFTAGGRPEPKYRCATAKAMGPEMCQGGYITARFVEDEVLERLQELAGDVDVARAAALEAKAHRSTVRSETTRLARQVARLEEALSRLAVQHAETPLPAAVYRSSYEELAGQLVELESALEVAQRDLRGAVASPRAAARSLLDGWDETPVAMRREQLTRLIAYVDVQTGRPRGSARVVWRFEV